MPSVNPYQPIGLSPADQKTFNEISTHLDAWIGARIVELRDQLGAKIERQSKDLLQRYDTELKNSMQDFQQLTAAQKALAQNIQAKLGAGLPLAADLKQLQDGIDNHEQMLKDRAVKFQQYATVVGEALPALLKTALIL